MTMSLLLQKKKGKICREEILETQKVKWHPRHKWQTEYEDCSRCGGGQIKWCSRCGEQKEL